MYHLTETFRNGLLCLCLTTFLFSSCKNGEKQESTEQESTEQGSSANESMQPGTVNDSVVTDEEIQQFVSALKTVQQVQQEAQTEMVNIIKEAGMEVPRFNEIYQHKSNPADSTNISEEEEMQFDTINKHLSEYQSGLNTKYENAIKETGMPVERYQAIMVIAKKDTTVMLKIQEQIQQQQQQQQPQQPQQP